MRRHHGGRAVSPYAGRTAAPLSPDVTLVRSFDSMLNPTRPARQSPLATSQIQGMPLDLIDRIRSFPLFESTPDSFLTEVGSKLKPQMQSPNDYILTEGDDAKAMYWLVRGTVAVTSRDGESTYAELKPGAFFGEIGILMERPRTATVVARTRCLLVVLKKEDLRKILPSYPDVERAIREEALERLNILEKKKKQALGPAGRRGSKRARELAGDEMDYSLTEPGVNGNSKRRKSPSPGMRAVPSTSALGHGLVNVRSLLRELPLFKNLPSEMLHFLGLNAQPQSYPPFSDIIQQGSTGREVYFIVKGEVEVVDEEYHYRTNGRRGSRQRHEVSPPPHVKARLSAGQYFGEVVSLSLADRRTATVRSISSVECLMISGEVLKEFWERCPDEIRGQIAETAQQRLESASHNDVIMEDADLTPDIDELVIGEPNLKTPKKPPLPRVTFNDAEIGGPVPIKPDKSPVLEPSDPDPFTSISLDKVKSRSRRGSLAPISPDEIPDKSPARTSPRRSPRSPSSPHSGTPSPLATQANGQGFFDPFPSIPRPRRKPQRIQSTNYCIVPDNVLLNVFSFLPLNTLMRMQGVSQHFQQMLTKSPHLLHVLDLSIYNRQITDTLLINRICPFVGARPHTIDVSNCFHITDEGFGALANVCGANVTCWKMKSVWDVTAPAILEMSNVAKGLQQIDLSNCRKVSDTLLARVVGWVVPGQPQQQQTNGAVRPKLNTRVSSNAGSRNPPPPPPPPPQPAPGTVFGCPALASITLSYCKHITDRSMHHIATHAAGRIESMDLTRCTTVTDTGFQYWGNANFAKLRRLCLADCTYLTDKAIISLTHTAGGLRELDLSFCCALSDTSTEVLSLGCPQLTHLNMSFCGSAVSDPSLRSVGRHLSNLKSLSVRGCVRVTTIGVSAVLGGAARGKLEFLDVSQCRNFKIDDELEQLLGRVRLKTGG